MQSLWSLRHASFSNASRYRRTVCTGQCFFTTRNTLYKKSLLFPILEPLYKKYGGDGRVIAKTSLKLAESTETLLDIGCITGGQLSHFKAFCPQIQAVGIDIDSQAKEKADNSIKKQIIIDDFLEYEFNRHFDIITLKFVIEHLLDFRPYIEKIVNLLSPNGLLFLSTPDIDSPKARQMKTDWPLINNHYIKIGHLRWFNKQSLYHLAEAFDLKILKIMNRGELLYHLPVKLQNILISLLGKDETGMRLIKYYAPRITHSILFNGLLPKPISYGDSIYAFMTKKARSYTF